MPTRMPSLKPRELPSAGPHAAVCYLFANLGTQHTKFGLKEQLCFGFELLDQRQANGTAFTIITLPYTISSEPKASLRQDMESWFGRAFTSDDFGALDLEERVGTTALLGVEHVLSNGKEYANIASIMPPPPGAPARKLPINGVVIFNFAERFGEYEQLPRFLQEKIASTPQYEARTNPNAVPALSTQERLQQRLAIPDPASRETPEEPPEEEQPSPDDAIVDDGIPF